MTGEPIRILLIEDNPADALLVHELLEESKGDFFPMQTTDTLKSGLEYLSRETFDIILSDLSLPDSSPASTFPALHQKAPSIPIVVMTGLNDRGMALESVQQGCQDYLVKGKFDSEMLVRAIRYAIERQRLVQELQTLSVSDSLTGLHNRRSFFAIAEHHKKISARSKKGFYVFFADVDGMKKVNDTFGHQEGDRALKAIAYVLRSTFRDSDIVARVGGDEFAILALDEMRDSAGVIEARLQKNLRSYQEKEELKYPLTLSLGSAYYQPGDTGSIEDLLAQADEKMYAQKQARLKK